MAITITWGTKVINVPRADMTLIQASPEIRELDIDAFRLSLKSLEDDEDGIAFPYTHDHVAPKSFSGVTLARVIEIINGYTVSFEDGQYAVNLVGANSNISDVTNVNQVSIRSFNSAGLTYSAEIRDIQTKVTNNNELLNADEIYTTSQATKYRAGTQEILLQKNVTGAPKTNITMTE